MIHLEIEGNPIAKQRPRFAKNGRAYDKQSKEKRITRCQIMNEMANRSILRRLQGPISIKMIFHMPIPSSWSQRRSKSVLGKPHSCRIDIDNAVKFYFDVMNQLIYDDDAQVSELYCKKIYSDKPRVCIEINEIKET